MTKMKLCGISRMCDIEMINDLKPDYIGFVFWPKSHRAVSKEQARLLKAALDPSVKTVGVFVDESLEEMASLLKEEIIDVAQLHGNETEEDIIRLKELTGCPVFKAFTILKKEDVEKANASVADCVLLDSGKGSGKAFEWSLLKGIKRNYFLAGGLNLQNLSTAIEQLDPYGVDVSSGIETDRKKDPQKMREFVNIVRNRM